jgi:hypothetical protein
MARQDAEVGKWTEKAGKLGGLEAGKLGGLEAGKFLT